MRRALVLLVVWAAGCDGSHVGNPSELTVALTGYDGAVPGQLTLSSGVTVDEAWVVLGRLRLRSADDCSRRDESTNVPAPLAAELVEARLLPGPPELAIDATRYCRVELQFTPLGDGELDGAPADLVGRSVLVRGARADGVPFELSAAVRDPFRLDAEDDPFEVPEGAAGLVVGFAMDEWLDAATLDAAEVGTRDGAPFVTIDARQNEALHDAFRDAVRASAGLFPDLDRDGRLDTTERNQLLGRGVLE